MVSADRTDCGGVSPRPIELGVEDGSDLSVCVSGSVWSVGCAADVIG